MIKADSLIMNRLLHVHVHAYAIQSNKISDVKVAQNDPLIFVLRYN